MKKRLVDVLNAIFLVVLMAVAPLSGPVGTATAAEPAATLPRYLSTDRLIVKFRDPAVAEAGVLSADMLGTLSAEAGVPLAHVRQMSGGAQILRLPGNMALDEARAIAETLQINPAVEYAEPDTIMRALLVPNDTFYTNQWHYKEFTTEIGGINLPPAWDVTTGSPSVVIAVIDTGLVPHADIDGNILDGTGRVAPGYDFVSLDTDLVTGCNGLPCTANDGDGRDSDPTDPGDWITAAENAGTDPTGGFFAGCGVSNSSWHGTHVTGTIGALSNNSAAVAGVNWNSMILPVRVLGKCGGYLSDIAEGMQWAAGLAVTGVPANTNPAKVMNLSLGGPGACGPTYQNAIDAITAVGAAVVVAAGNDNVDVANSQPANCSGVIAVAATSRLGAKASYSNFGTLVKIAAPGGDTGDGVLSTLNSGTTSPVASPAGDTIGYYMGTSMAAPHVTGAVSLMFSLNASLTPAQILSTLQSTARVFPTGTGNDCTTLTCGAGIVNAAAALGVTASPPPPPPPTPPPLPPPPPVIPSPCPTGPGSMPLPTGPTAFSCTDGAAGICGIANPAQAHPLGAVNVAGNLVLQLGFVPFAAPVDIYQVAQLPSGQQLIMNNLKQWLPFPANTVPYRANSASAVNFDTLFQTPLASIPPGNYAAYTVVVPAGTDPVTFSLASSPYYLWCTTRTLP